MYKIAVLGDAQSVEGFAALGLQVCPAENAEQARPILHRLAKEDTATIYVTEQLAAGLTAELDRYRKAVTPAIILIPGKEGSLGRVEGCFTAYLTDYSTFEHTISLRALPSRYD